MTDATKTIISRIQQRRGLKQDLPQPLRPGEIGFATDTNQLYIGADPIEYYNQFNKVSRIEQISGAAVSLNSITKHKLIRFTVPFHQFTVTSPGTDFTWSSGTVFGTRNGLNHYTNSKFIASTVSVFKNGDRQYGDTTEPYSVTIDATKDFKIDCDLLSPTDRIKFRKPLSTGDVVTINFYDKSAILDAIIEPGNITISSVSTKKGFYDEKNIPPSLRLDPELVTVSETSGRGFIGVEDKHLVPFVYAQPSTNIGLINLGNLFVQSSTIPGVNATINLGSPDTVANLVAVFNAANTFLKMEKDLANTLYITMNMANSNVFTTSFSNTSFVLSVDNSSTANVLNIPINTPFTPDNNSVKSYLEHWIQECVTDSNLNIFTSAVVGEALSPTSGINVDTGLYQVNATSEFLELTHVSKEETQAFNQVVNGVYILQNIATNRTGLVNIKTNIEIPTELSSSSMPSGMTFSLPFETVIPGSGPVPDFLLPTGDYDTYIVEYSVSIKTGSPSTGNYQRVGTMMLSGRPDISSVAFTDTATEVNQTTGSLSFSASMVGTDIVLSASTTLPTMKFRYIFRRWKSV